MSFSEVANVVKEMIDLSVESASKELEDVTVKFRTSLEKSYPEGLDPKLLLERLGRAQEMASRLQDSKILLEQQKRLVI